MPRISTGYNIGIKLFGTVIAQQTINVFYFNSTLFAETATSTLTAWWSSISAHLLPLLSNAVVFTSAELQEEGGGGVFGSIPLSDVGGTSGDCLPPFVAWDFTYLRGGALERNGYKRFAGVPESFQQSGFATSTAIAQAAVIASDLGAGFVNNLDVWHPVIRRTRVHKVAVIPPQFFSVSSVSYSKIGSQNSRKFGHGN